LQREANSRFGFSAKTTLSIAQALYEKHKVLTYPRTDSRALPEDYLATVKQTIGMLAEEDLPGPLRELSARHKALKEGYVKPTKRVFDNTKVSDHFAIIPTLQAPKSLTEIELKLYDMVVKRFLAVFYPSAEFMVTTRISTVKLPTRPTPVPDQRQGAGQRRLAGRLRQGSAGRRRQPGGRGPGEMVRTESVDVLALKTKPPARYTEATLLSAMEGAGKLIEDEELRDAMKEKGLGTPATRAQTIEGLIAEKYMLRDGRELVPTAKAFQLMTLLRGLAIEDLTRPDLTGNWEYQLAEMEHGRLSRQAFMAEIAQMAERIVKKAKEYDRDTIPGDYATLATPCPNCGGVVKENYRRFACTGATGVDEGCGFSITKIPAGRAFETTEAEAFCATRRSVRWRVSAPRRAGPSPPRSSWCATTRSTTGSWSSTSAKTRARPKATANRWTFRASRAWAPAPSARAMSTNTAATTCANTAWAQP
jgi:DNA topoisomerase-3